MQLKNAEVKHDDIITTAHRALFDRLDAS